MPKKTTASMNPTSLPKAPKAKGRPKPRPVIKIKPSRPIVDLTNENPNPPISNPNPSVSNLSQTPDPLVSTQSTPLQQANLHPQTVPVSGFLPNSAPAKKLVTSTAKTTTAQDNTILAAKLATVLGKLLLL